MTNRFRFGLAVLGCRANQAENDAVRSELLALGGEEVRLPGTAEVIIVNTCAVTSSAQAQSRQEVRRLIRACESAVVIVTGCAAQLAPDEFANLEGVDLVLGNQAKARLPELLQRLYSPETVTEPAKAVKAAEAAGLMPALSPDRVAAVCWDANPVADGWLERGTLIPQTRLRPVLKVQDGCPYKCTYCIVSELRGSPRSRDLESVMVEARQLVRAGYNELVLAGINLGLYGALLSAPGGRYETDGRPLAALISELSRLDGLRRIRLSSLEPMTINDGLLDCIAETPKVAPHFHISFQTGDDEQLARMGRPYTTDGLRRLIGRISSRMPHFGLGVDIVAGYAGESDDAFERTLALLEELPVTYIHPFAYSERPGTVGADASDTVPHCVRKERVGALRALDTRLRRRFGEGLANRRCAILVDRAADGRFSGISGEFVRLGGEADSVSRGDWLEVVALEPNGSDIHPCRLAT
jgi:threonylcarbamoyladenosine tRNA methylthiotransferase MtaB